MSYMHALHWPQRTSKVHSLLFFIIFKVCVCVCTNLIYYRVNGDSDRTDNKTIIIQPYLNPNTALSLI